MSTRPTAPADRELHSSEEREFGLHEIFFSITDRKGIIRYGNEVFTRVSGYPKAAMIGKPHNLIRHPDMPRVVFKLLWDEIGAGRPVAAYVKNRASDGRYYWVMAMVLPAPDGYLSIRIKPSSPLFAAVQDIYQDLRDIERSIEGADGLRRKEGMESSGERLQHLLTKAGFETYDAFMRTAILGEVRLREEHRQTSGAGRRSSARLGQRDGFDAARAGLAQANHFLSDLVLRLDDYIKLNSRLAEDASFIRALADEVLLFALNAIVAASKADGSDGAAIGAVAGLLRMRSESSSTLFRELGDSVLRASETLDRLLFPVVATGLASQMLEVFMAEFASSGAGDRDPAEVLALHACVQREASGLARLLDEFDGRLHTLQANIRGLRRELDAMRALGLNGRIEAARIEDSGPFSSLFATVGTQVAAAATRLDELQKSGASLFTNRDRTAADIESAVAATAAAIRLLDDCARVEVEAPAA
ncbi:MAG: PAS domain S-box protein [Dehalococcoidia bacterium]|nr:PAS domain S-box protein [Dehalococcoidia bacterium]